MKKAFDKKVKPREFREGDLVLRKIMSFNADSRDKWTPNFEGPYVVKKSFTGEEFPHPMNADVVKKYFS